MEKAVNPDAETKFDYYLCRRDVLQLRHTHSDIGDGFKNGPHRGQRVDALTHKLLKGEASITSITPLVAIRYDGLLWVVFGN